jgi:dTDP-4-amino-4,6-dideoxygalactose transaminase
MYALGVGPGDEVISPTWNWICSIAPAPILGATPVFCDLDPATMLLDPVDLKRKITKRTKAIIAVHLWGWVCDMDAIMKVAGEAGVPVIEDCSHAHGAFHRNRPVGSIGQIGCWSMQGSKPVSAGEGGIMATNDTPYYERACLIGQVNRMAGMDLVTPDYEKYQPLGTGMKFRAHPVAMGIAMVQLGRLGHVNEGRKKWVEGIEAGLADVPCLTPLPRIPETARAGYYGFPVRFLPAKAKGGTAKRLVELLNAEGVKANLNPYPLLHQLPYFAEGFDLFGGNRGPLAAGYKGYKAGDLPVAEREIGNIVFLPVLTDPIDGALDMVLARIRKAAAAL